jgi:hypothetical protein
MQNAAINLATIKVMTTMAAKRDGDKTHDGNHKSHYDDRNKGTNNNDQGDNDNGSNSNDGSEKLIVRIAHYNKIVSLLAIN